MNKNNNFIFTIIIAGIVILALCTGLIQKNFAAVRSPNDEKPGKKDKAVFKTEDVSSQPTELPVPPEIDLNVVKPDESGKIMVVMFHNFVEEFTPSATDKKGEYTMTFDSFRKLLDTLYEKNYRPINMKDYLDNNINVAAGCKPIVFTFDDGTAGEFNFIHANGNLEVNPKSAVAIMEEFNRTHSDFMLKGTFYINLGGGVFKGEGTVEQRLRYLIDRGFEIGNHTYNHVDFHSVTTKEKVMEEAGRNQKEIEVMIPGYKMETLSLPLGHTTKDESLRTYIEKGNYEGIEYENKGIVLVGANPALPSVHKDFNPFKIPRVRSSGITKVDSDLDWWLGNTPAGSEYISDGDPNTVTVPKSKEDRLDKSKMANKNLRTY